MRCNIRTKRSTGSGQNAISWSQGSPSRVRENFDRSLVLARVLLD
jgi:hypothetical protein